MQPNQRIVVQTPLTELWDDSGPIALSRLRTVGRDDVADLLRSGPVRFVIANCGQRLTWVPVTECYRFWKEDVKAHLVEPGVVGLRLDTFPGGYCYIGTEWGGEQGPVVLLETNH